MTYFIEKDHKWFTSKQTWTKYYTEAVPFKTTEIAYAWAKDLNISGYIITEHYLPKTVTLLDRIKSFFTIISQKEINEAVGHGFKEYIR